MVGPVALPCDGGAGIQAAQSSSPNTHRLQNALSQKCYREEFFRGVDRESFFISESCHGSW